MVAKLLNLCGLYLGGEKDLMPAASDNPDGFCENLRFVDLNEEILGVFHAGWDHPPDTALDIDSGRLSTLRQAAESLLKEFNGREPWGWKDPRNSLTLPFWLDIVPGLKVVICVRNPLEVALSLNKRNFFSYALSLNLWEAYNRRLLAAVPAEKRVVTHYDAYFARETEELERVLYCLGIQANEDMLNRCRSAVSASLRHSELSMHDLGKIGVKAEVRTLYSELCREANWNDESEHAFLPHRKERARREQTGSKGTTGISLTADDAHETESGLDQSMLHVLGLRRALEERTAWAKGLDAELIEREGRLRTLQEQNQVLQRERDDQARQVRLLSLEKQSLGEMFQTLAERMESVEDILESLLRGDKGHVKKIENRRLIGKIREIVWKEVPAGATVLVVSKGDDQLRCLEGRQGWHFPQDRDGNYSGFVPADSGSAIVQLEALRSKGAQYLLIPAPAFWWLDHYSALKRHLDLRYRELLRREDACLIYSLCEPPAALGHASRALEAVIDEYVTRFGCAPAILDWDTRLGLAEAFPAQVVFSPPEGTGAVLPYLDQTVDIVVLAHVDPVRASEARRVASAAIVESPPREDLGAASRVEWLRQPTAPPLPTTSIIIPSYNGIALTEACLAALVETLPSDFRGEIIVVDDCSTDDTQPRLAGWAAKEPRLKVLRNSENCGFLVTCNNGAAAAAGEIIVLLNNDTLPQRGWLEPLLRTFQKQRDAGAVGGKLVYPDGRLQEAGGVVFSDGSAANFGKWDYELDAPLYNYVREVDYVTGALIATPRNLFNELGGLDTWYRPIYYEETDYCFRLRQKGFKVYYQPESVVIHLEGVTCGTDTTSGQKRHQVVNREKFRERWHDVLCFQPPPPAKFDSAAWYGLAVRGNGEDD
jgi:GT2 family glycosyltransferase